MDMWIWPKGYREILNLNIIPTAIKQNKALSKPKMVDISKEGALSITNPTKKLPTAEDPKSKAPWRAEAKPLREGKADIEPLILNGEIIPRLKANIVIITRKDHRLFI